MDFDRLGPSDPGGSSRRSTAPLTNSTTSNSSQKNKKLIMISILAAALIIASAISAALITVVRSRASSNDQNSPNHRAKPTQAISRTCSKTRFPTLCISSLLDFPGSTAANEQQLVHISFNMTHRHISKALFASSGLSYAVSNSRVRAAYEDCLELMDESVDSIRMSMDSLSTMSSTLSRADELSTIAGSEDVMTWLSAALTNQDTCLEGFEDISGTVKDQMVDNLKDLSELVSNSLAIFSGSGDYDFTGVPIQNKRRLLGIEKEENDDDVVGDISREFPKWLKKRDRRLLSLPVSEIQADIIVSKSGNGTVKTITEAIKKAPDHGSRRFIIYVRAGRYEENNLKVGKKKTNIMFIGDGTGKTVITGQRSVGDGMTTFHTASFDLHLLSLDLLSVAAQSPIRRPPLSLSHIRRTFPPTTALTLSYPPHLCSVNLKPYHLSASRLLQRPLLSIFSASQQRFLVRLHCCIASSSDFARSTRKGVVDLEIEK